MSLSLLYWEPQNWTQNSTCVSPELSRGEESPVTICWQCSSWQSPRCCWLYFCTGTLLAHMQLGEAVVPKSRGVSPHSQSPSRVSSLSDCSRLDQARSWGVLHTQTPALLLAVSDPHILVLHKEQISIVYWMRICSLLIVILQMSQVLKRLHFRPKFKIHCLL